MLQNVKSVNVAGLPSFFTVKTLHYITAYAFPSCGIQGHAWCLDGRHRHCRSTRTSFWSVSAQCGSSSSLDASQCDHTKCIPAVTTFHHDPAFPFLWRWWTPSNLPILSLHWDPSFCSLHFPGRCRKYERTLLVPLQCLLDNFKHGEKSPQTNF